MKIEKLTTHEKQILSLINKDRTERIQWDKMPQQEVYTHIYGWDNPHIDINLLLTPREKMILLRNGHDINNGLKRNIPLLRKTRIKRKNP